VQYVRGDIGDRVLVVAVKPGLNTISRSSALSALTINQDSVYTAQKDKAAIRRANQCRCGWPQTLLVPRGTQNGTTYRLFAMVTDYTEDKVGSTYFDCKLTGTIAPRLPPPSLGSPAP
jgi:hypothetical protein